MQMAAQKEVPKVQSVNRIPEKQMHAIPMKKINSEIMARNDLGYLSTTYKKSVILLQDNNSVGNSEKSQSAW